MAFVPAPSYDSSTERAARRVTSSISATVSGERAVSANALDDGGRVVSPSPSAPVRGLAVSDHHRVSLPRNSGSVTLRRQPWTLPETVPFGALPLKPLCGGETLAWQLIDEAAP